MSLGDPLEVEFAFLKSLYDLELVRVSPVFSRVLLEVYGEVWVNHCAGQILSRQGCETLPHEFVDDVLVRLVSCYDVIVVKHSLAGHVFLQRGLGLRD